MKWTKWMLAMCAGLAVLSGSFAMMPHEGIEEIMEKGFKKGGIKQQIDNEIRKDQPNWSDVEKKASELSKLCTALCKEKQPQGEADSWKKLTEALAGNVKALSTAAGKKDQASAKATMARINNSCKECHDIHRP